MPAESVRSGLGGSARTHDNTYTKTHTPDTRQIRPKQRAGGRTDARCGTYLREVAEYELLRVHHESLPHIFRCEQQRQHAPVRTSGRDIWAAGMVLARLFGGAHTKDAIEAYRQYSRCKMETGKMYELAREISQALETDAAAGWFV